MKIEMEEREITFKIDGKEVKAKEGMSILEAAKKVGVDVPTLCYHQALSPFGACRLCSVEITDKHGRKRIVTSCNYIAEEGLIVDTKSPDVIEGRKMILELLLARCPKVKKIQDLAQAYGVEKPRFKLKEETCILCGLCTRVCEERMGVSAINFVGRGVNRVTKTPFQATLDINLDICMACGACEFVCPTEAIKLEEHTSKKPIPLPSEFELGLTSRAPIYIPFPQAVPLIPTIDSEKCVHFIPGTGECGICKEVCEPDAIDFDQKEEIIELEVGTIIVATGYDTLDPKSRPEYGYNGKNVITGLEFERLCNASGPTGGEITVNGRKPKNVIFIQCVGSREKEGNSYCSRVCCMYTAKHAHLVKEKLPDANVTVFYTDVRAFGKGFEEFYTRVQAEGAVYKRRELEDPIQVVENNGSLVVKAKGYDDINADLVILATAIVPHRDSEKLAKLLNIPLSPDGFLSEAEPKLRPLDTLTDGIFVAGCCQSPKDIPDTVAQASGAALKASIPLLQGKIEVEPLYAVIDKDRCGGCRICEGICSYSALKYDPENKIMTVNEVLCKGCGGCSATCPSGAIRMSHFNDLQIIAQLGAMLT